MTISNQLFEGLHFKGNVFLILIYRLLLMMLLLTCCRVGFYLYNTSFFPEMTARTFLGLLFGGMVFDLVTLLYFNALYILLTIIPLDIRFGRKYQAFLKYLFFVTNGLAMAMNVADFVYYEFTLRRTTADVMTQFENETNMAGLWLKFIVDYWYAALFWIVLMAMMIAVYNIWTVRGPQLRNRVVYYVAGVSALPVIAYLIIGGVRGGFAHSTRPITLSNAGEYVDDPKHISIVLNTPFSIIRTIGKTKVQRADFFSAREVETIYPVEHYPTDTVAFKPYNVIVIILESFSKEFVGVFNPEKENGRYKGYTPFLDSLAGHSLRFEYSFANGRKSIDGLPSVISSIPSLGVPYFLSPYSGNRINSLASLLGRKNYHTSFFHGAPNGSMGFQAFMNLAGVDEYYGMDDYSNKADYDGLWGIWDEKFLAFYAEKINTFKEPFFSSFFSLSSHHPFKVPQEYETKFKGGSLVIHKCVEYTDYSLRKFFERVKDESWYANTLFVITADHTSSEIQFDETRTAWGFYSVPVLYFRPDNSLAGIDTTVTQQVDIMPSILGYMNYDEPFIAYGRNIFSKARDGFAYQYKDNAYQLIQDNYLYQFDGKKGIALYDFKADKLLRTNILDKHLDVAGKMETRIKAVIQQYNNRMIEDRLTIRETP